MPALSPTLTAPCGGVTERTTGADVSVVAPVKKCQKPEFGCDAAGAAQARQRLNRVERIGLQVRGRRDADYAAGCVEAQRRVLLAVRTGEQHRRIRHRDGSSATLKPSVTTTLRALPLEPMVGFASSRSGSSSPDRLRCGTSLIRNQRVAVRIPRGAVHEHLNQRVRRPPVRWSEPRSPAVAGDLHRAWRKLTVLRDVQRAAALCGSMRSFRNRTSGMLRPTPEAPLPGR